jgi:FixJ family two-component response regulator
LRSDELHPLALTRRQRDVLALVLRGLTSRQIADQLLISHARSRNTSPVSTPALESATEAKPSRLSPAEQPRLVLERSAITVARFMPSGNEQG